MAYHRFYTPLDIFTEAFGVHRETCIDEIFFDEKGEMVITPTLEGVPAVYMWKAKLNKSALSLTVGQSETLKATVEGSESAMNKSLVWSSDKTTVASVDQNGKVTAKAAGTANITVTASNGCKTICKVTVKSPVKPPKPIKVNKVTLNKKSLTLGVKEKFTLKATVKPNNATNRKVTWKSNKPKIAAVSKSGKVTAKKTGKAVITAKADNKTARCTVTVKADVEEG